jgi:hypothetical protein
MALGMLFLIACLLNWHLAAAQSNETVDFSRCLQAQASYIQSLNLG